MRLQKLINECADALQKRASEDFLPGGEDDPVSVNVPTEHGEIDIYYKKGEVEVIVYHDDNDHDSRNLQDYLAENLDNCIDWDEIHDDYIESWADEYQQHGFASESDFWHWKEG